MHDRTHDIIRCMDNTLVIAPSTRMVVCLMPFYQHVEAGDTNFFLEPAPLCCTALSGAVSVLLTKYCLS